MKQQQQQQQNSAPACRATPGWASLLLRVRLFRASIVVLDALLRADSRSAFFSFFIIMMNSNKWNKIKLRSVHAYAVYFYQFSQSANVHCLVQLRKLYAERRQPEFILGCFFIIHFFIIEIHNRYCSFKHSARSNNNNNDEITRECIRASRTQWKSFK